MPLIRDWLVRRAPRLYTPAAARWRHRGLPHVTNRWNHDSSATDLEREIETPEIGGEKTRVDGSADGSPPARRVTAEKLKPLVRRVYASKPTPLEEETATEQQKPLVRRVAHKPKKPLVRWVAAEPKKQLIREFRRVAVEPKKPLIRKIDPGKAPYGKGVPAEQPKRFPHIRKVRGELGPPATRPSTSTRQSPSWLKPHGKPLKLDELPIGDFSSADVNPLLRIRTVTARTGERRKFSTSTRQSSLSPTVLPEESRNEDTKLSQAPSIVIPEIFRDEKDIIEARVALSARGDYTGRVIPPKSSDKAADPEPWSIPHEYAQDTLDGMERLKLEIANFATYATPSPMEQRARGHVIKQIRKFVGELYSYNRLELFGSTKLGLALALSDIDLRLCPATELFHQRGKEAGKAKRQHLLNILKTLQVAFERDSNYEDSQFLTSRYPLVRTLDKTTGLEVQIVLGHSSRARNRRMLKYMAEYPYLQDLYVLLKSTLEVRLLTNVFMGGIGAYPLFMMIIASLQMNPPSAPTSAAGLLSFLEFWSTFDTSQGLSVSGPPFTFDKVAEPIVTPPRRFKPDNSAVATVLTFEKPLSQPKPPKRPLPTWLLSLRDPSNAHNDLGRKFASIKHFQATCQHLLSHLRAQLATTDRIDRNPTLLREFVGPMPYLTESKREKVRALGETLHQQRKIRLHEEKEQGGLQHSGGAVKILQEVEAKAMHEAVHASPTPQNTNTPITPQNPHQTTPHNQKSRKARKRLRRQRKQEERKAKREGRDQRSEQQGKKKPLLRFVLTGEKPGKSPVRLVYADTAPTTNPKLPTANSNPNPVITKYVHLTSANPDPGSVVREYKMPPPPQMSKTKLRREEWRRKHRGVGKKKEKVGEEKGKGGEVRVEVVKAKGE
ncbi:hypothetical protein M011DRAFT_477801 [Sporormia fimetaria CBS 119925]|uniref:Poly(A) RNA polymerase mitochondrial-like central palm domain-containing protein n=1 Tax=Sporormia fimetaria CBS 119925 TaxID=1340428 RepID=A0A6A6V8Y2_9PLEO|nr:hypothetical protein M011DRAFT_477801 [Sporormia fimetaria CBS 119925]